MLPYPTVSSNIWVQSFYEQLRENGESHNMADLLAHQRPPASTYTNTDRAFMHAFDGDPVPFIPDSLKGQVIANVEANGIQARGKVYCAKLADTRGPLDPEAWVSGVDDIKRVATKRNLNVSGVVEVKGTPSKTPDVPLAEDLIQNHMREELQKKPNADRRELREGIIDKHAMKWSE